MIRDVMVWLDGGISDEVRLAAVADIARWLETKVIIGLFLNPLPLPGPVEGDATAELIERAREAGDEIEKLLARRLQLLERPVEIRRFDVLADDIAKIAAREARSADTFVALRPNGAMDPEQLVEGVLVRIGPAPLFGSRDRAAKDRLRSHPGRLERQPGIGPSLEPKAMPFLYVADEVTVVVVTERAPDRGRGGHRCRCRQSSQASRDRRRPSSRQEPPQRSRSPADGRGANGERLTSSSWADTVICACVSGCSAV